MSVTGQSEGAGTTPTGLFTVGPLDLRHRMELLALDEGWWLRELSPVLEFFI